MMAQLYDASEDDQTDDISGVIFTDPIKPDAP
jgi:hypothetical protein